MPFKCFISVSLQIGLCFHVNFVSKLKTNKLIYKKYKLKKKWGENVRGAKILLLR